MVRRCLLLFMGVLFFAITASAEENNPMNLDEIVVTATRTETEASQAPASTSVVTGNDIAQRTVLAPDEALNTLPGVFDTRGKGLTDVMSSINLRGMPGQERTLILLDGMPLNSAYTGNVQFGGMSPEDIRQIEVIRGPFSSLYGGYAMGGVVNILTKMPEKEEVTVTGSYGSNDYWRGYVSVGDKYANKLSIFFSTGYQATGGYPSDFVTAFSPPPAGITGWSQTRTSTNTASYLIGDTGNNSWWDQDITAKVAYDFTPTSRLSVAYYRTAYQYQYGPANSYLYNSAGANVFSYGNPFMGGVSSGQFTDTWGGMATDTYKASYQTELGDIKTKVQMGMMKQGENWYISPGYPLLFGYLLNPATQLSGGPGTLNSSPSTSYFGDIQATKPIFDRHILTVGGSYRYDWEGTTEWNLSDWKDQYTKTSILDQSGGREQTYALFAQDEIQILKPLKAYIGAREDWWRVYGGFSDTYGVSSQQFPSNSTSYFSPKGALVYTPFDGTVLRTSFGQAFRPPTIYELFRTAQFYGITWYANPLLKPETTTSWEIGGEQKLWKGGVFKATYFDNHVSNFIEQPINLATMTANQVNVGKSDIQGVELALEQRFDKWLHLFLNYTLNDAKVVRDTSDPASVGHQLTNMPLEMLNAGGDFTYNAWSGSLIGRYVSKQYGEADNSDRTSGVFGSYDPYFTADAKLSYQITSFASVSLAARNIFNERYFAYYQAPGRQWFSTLTVRF